MTAFTRRQFCTMTAALFAGAAVPAFAADAPSVTIAVGGKNLYYYLPMAVADWLGYYKEEGVNVKVVDFAGGSKALQAVIGGSADIVSGAFEHTLTMQTKKQAMTAFVLQDRAPQVVFCVNKKTMPDFKRLEDLRGKRLGVTAPGSSSHVIANYVLATAGIRPTEMKVIGIGAGAGALNAVRTGMVDCFVSLDPIIATLEQDNLIQIITDTRNIAESDALFKGPMAAGCLYAKTDYINANRDTIQRITNAIVRAERFIAKATPEEMLRIVPTAAQIGGPAIYTQGFLKNRPAFSADGIFPEGCAEVAAAAVTSAKPEVAGFPFDYKAAFTNEFVKAVPAAK